MYVKVDDSSEGLEKAIRIFNRKVKQAELMQELRNRRFYLKPSEQKVFKRKEAIRRRKREERRVQRQSRYGR